MDKQNPQNRKTDGPSDHGQSFHGRCHHCGYRECPHCGRPMYPDYGYWPDWTDRPRYPEYPYSPAVTWTINASSPSASMHLS